MGDAVFRSCPGCESEDTPILVVRGSGAPGNGMSLRCRTCSAEWADLRSSYSLYAGARQGDGWWPGERRRMG